MVQTPSGGAYSGGYGGFTNYVHPDVQAYNVDLAVAAAKLGVDDILYDYVRRPDGPLIDGRSRAQGRSGDAVVGFLANARRGSLHTTPSSAPPYSASRPPGPTRSRRTCPPSLARWTTSRRCSIRRTGGQTSTGSAIPSGSPTRSSADRYSTSTVQYAGRGREWCPGSGLLARRRVRRARGQGADRRHARGRHRRVPALGSDGHVRKRCADEKCSAADRGLAHCFVTGFSAARATPRSRSPRIPCAAASPSELGVVPVLMYHRLLPDGGGDYDLTPDQFRTELTRLYRNHYRPVTASALVMGRIDLPRGASPVVLTFDDSATSQAALLEDGRIDPDSAVGIMLEFARDHPDSGPQGRSTSTVSRSETTRAQVSSPSGSLGSASSSATTPRPRPSRRADRRRRAAADRARQPADSRPCARMRRSRRSRCRTGCSRPGASSRFTGRGTARAIASPERSWRAPSRLPHPRPATSSRSRSRAFAAIRGPPAERFIRLARAVEDEPRAALRQRREVLAAQAAEHCKRVLGHDLPDGSPPASTSPWTRLAKASASSRVRVPTMTYVQRRTTS